MKCRIDPRSLVLLALCASFLYGQEQPPPERGMDERLKRFDTDGDGKLSESERQAIRERIRQRGSRPGALTPSGTVETVGNREVTELQYASSDGRKIPAVLSRPKGDGPFPVVVTIHGGQGDRDFAYLRTMAAPNSISPTVNALNEQPWAILAISYRAGGILGPEEDDVTAGIRFAKTIEKTDPARVGVLGGSHGGHLALRAAEILGKDILCVAAGSPWMTNPRVYFYGKPEEPPLSLVSPDVRTAILEDGRRLLGGLQKRGLSAEEIEKRISDHSIEGNAEKIVVPALFLTSTADESVPHALVQPTIERLKTAGRDVAVYTAAKSPHGFYWGRDVGGARIGRGPKTPEELAEEAAAREQILGFLKKGFGGEPEPGGKAALTPERAKAVRDLRSRLEDRPVPENLQRRTIRVGEAEREYFLHIPDSVKGKAAPAVFALHGGASNSGLAMHLKVDYTKLAGREGFVVVYPSGVNGWNVGSHDAAAVRRRTSDADDLGFFKTMFDALEKEGVADPRRLYVTGGSNGGVMTQYLACHLADRIAGIGVVVATLPRAALKDWPRPSCPIPVAIMLGTADEFKPWEGNADQMSARETVDFWRGVNGCEGAPVKTDLPDRDPGDGTRVTTERWEGRAPVLFYRMEGHGHGWPMQRANDRTGTGPKTRDISAPEEFWSFLKGFHR